MQIEAPNMSGALESIQSRMPASLSYRSSSLLLHRRKIRIISNPIFYPTCSIPRPFTPILPESSRVAYRIFATSSKKENANHDPEELSQDLIPLPALSTGGQFVKTATLIGLGLVGEIVIASSFGVGPVATAFNKLLMDRQRKLFLRTNTIMLVVASIAAALIFVFAEVIIQVYAPG